MFLMALQLLRVDQNIFPQSVVYTDVDVKQCSWMDLHLMLLFPN